MAERYRVDETGLIDAVNTPPQAASINQRVDQSGLSLACIADVDAHFVTKTRGLSFARAMKVLDALIVEADTQLAADRAARAAEHRSVWFRHPSQGGTDMSARLTMGDANRLKATTLELAAGLHRAGDESSATRRQATALGLLATPARALAVLPAGLRDDHEALKRLVPTPRGPIAPDTLPIDDRPDPSLHRHCPHLESDHPADLLTRAPVYWRNPFGRFPFSTRASRLSDLDHITPWARNSRGGPTDTGDLIPLSRRGHRAKTAGHWIVHQEDPASYSRESPLGYRYDEGPNGSRLLVQVGTEASSSFV